MSSFGEELKRERELREISLREVAEATKVNVRYLEALERNDFQHLPGGVFNRGFVRAYAQFIGVDPEAMVNAYILEVRSQSSTMSVADAGVMRGQPRAAAAARQRTSARARPAARFGPNKLLRWGLVVILFAILVVAGLYLVGRFSSSAPGEGPTRPGSEVRGE